MACGVDFVLFKPLHVKIAFIAMFLIFAIRRGVGTTGAPGAPAPPENLTKGAGTFYYTAVQCSTARSVDLRVRASSQRVCARATLRARTSAACMGREL